MNKVLKEKDIYCFKAKLKHIDDDECFLVSYNVMAENKHKAQSILEEWLSNPKQTGFRFECCVGIIPQPSDTVIVVEDNKTTQSQGTWKHDLDNSDLGYDTYICSVCGESNVVDEGFNKPNYCPNCGARMGKE